MFLAAPFSEISDWEQRSTSNGSEPNDDDEDQKADRKNETAEKDDERNEVARVGTGLKTRMTPAKNGLNWQLIEVANSELKFNVILVL